MKCFSIVIDDGFHFRQLAGGRPVLGLPPKGNFDTAGRVRAWYSGEDPLPPGHQKIGLMEAMLGR